MLLVSGMGGSRAEAAARKLLENGAKALVSWGFAGGLLPALLPGTVLIPEKIVTADGAVYFPDLPWSRQLRDGLAGEVDLREGTIAESAGVAASAAEKRLLLRRTAASAVDMESASLARVAKESRAPFLAIRAITDSARSDIPRCALESIDEFGRVAFSSLLWGVFRRPAEFFALVRMGREVRAGEAALARVALRARSGFLCPRGGERNSLEAYG